MDAGKISGVHDLGHAELASGLIGRVAEKIRRVETIASFIRAGALERRQERSVHIHAGNIRLLERLDKAEDAVELLLEVLDFFRGKIDPGEIGDVADVDVFGGHGGRMLPESQRWAKDFFPAKVGKCGSGSILSVRWAVVAWPP